MTSFSTMTSFTIGHNNDLKTGDVTMADFLTRQIPGLYAPGNLAKVTLLREKINNTKPGITQHKLISSFQVEEVLIGNEQC